MGGKNKDTWKQNTKKTPSKRTKIKNALSIFDVCMAETQFSYSAVRLKIDTMNTTKVNNDLLLFSEPQHINAYFCSGMFTTGIV
jgi:hypothetical protein